MPKTSAVALESAAVRDYLETLRQLIALEIAEKPGVISVSKNGETYWDAVTSQIILPILIVVEGRENLALGALQSIVQETADLFFTEIQRTYHGSVRALRVQTSTR